MIQLKLSLAVVISYLFIQIYPYSVKDSYDYAEVVFIGKVVTEKEDSEVYWGDSEGTIYNFRIKEALKGLHSSRVGGLITYISFPRSWDYSFDKDSTYLIYARQGDSDFIWIPEGIRIAQGVEIESEKQKILAIKNRDSENHFFTPRQFQKHVFTKVSITYMVAGFALGFIICAAIFWRRLFLKKHTK
ncbi:MAG: hypothetical protein MI866_11750 [Bacteroidales bacterium]|nr:hypothetical protein [Bacteroidales bacterium]